VDGETAGIEDVVTPRTTLPACLRNHPGVESVIKVTVCRPVNAPAFERPHCTVCAQINQPKGRALRNRSVPDVYGVQRFGWTPPERLLNP
jgi:hypothetical protein